MDEKESQEKLTGKEWLKTWIDTWRNSYDETTTAEDKLEFMEEGEQAYNQLVELIDYAYTIPDTSERESELENIIIKMQDELDKRPAGENAWEHIEQQNARPKVSRENIKRFAMTKLEDEHHYEENAEAIACWLNALGWEVVEK